MEEDANVNETKLAQAAIDRDKREDEKEKLLFQEAEKQQVAAQNGALSELATVAEKVSSAAASTNWRM